MPESISKVQITESIQSSYQLVDYTPAMLSRMLWPTIKVQISGIAAELPHGARETSDIAVTAKAVLNTSRTYYNDDLIMRLSTVESWFDNRSKVSFYFLLEAGVVFEINTLTIQALDGAVGIILTSTYDSAVIHVVPNGNNAGRLHVTITGNYSIMYRTGDDCIAGYIEYKGPILPPKVANECYHRAVRRMLP